MVYTEIYLSDVLQVVNKQVQEEKRIEHMNTSSQTSSTSIYETPWTLANLYQTFAIVVAVESHFVLSPCSRTAAYTQYPSNYIEPSCALHLTLHDSTLAIVGIILSSKLLRWCGLLHARQVRVRSPGHSVQNTVRFRP